MVYVNDQEPSVAERIKHAAQNLATEIVPDDDTSIFLTGERTYLLFVCLFRQRLT